MKKQSPRGWSYAEKTIAGWIAQDEVDFKAADLADAWFKLQALQIAEIGRAYAFSPTG